MESLLKSHQVKVLSVDFFTLHNFRHRFGQLPLLQILDDELNFIDLNCCMDFLRHGFDFTSAAFLKVFEFLLSLKSFLLYFFFDFRKNLHFGFNTGLNFRKSFTVGLTYLLELILKILNLVFDLILSLFFGTIYDVR